MWYLRVGFGAPFMVVPGFIFKYLGFSTGFPTGLGIFSSNHLILFWLTGLYANLNSPARLSMYSPSKCWNSKSSGFCSLGT